MTTLAANLECMAADRRVSDSTDADEGGPTGWSYPANKLFRIGNSIFGTSGHGTMSLAFIEWLKTRRSRHELYKILGDYEREEIRVLELRGPMRRRGAAGIYVWDGWGYAEEVLKDHVAVGSGAKAAGALLDAGFTPRDAVRGAMKQDFFTGGEIDVMWLSGKPPVPTIVPPARQYTSKKKPQLK